MHEPSKNTSVALSSLKRTYCSALYFFVLAALLLVIFINGLFFKAKDNPFLVPESAVSIVQRQLQSLSAQIFRIKRGILSKNKSSISLSPKFLSKATLGFQVDCNGQCTKLGWLASYLEIHHKVPNVIKNFAVRTPETTVIVSSEQTWFDKMQVQSFSKSEIVSVNNSCLVSFKQGNVLIVVELNKTNFNFGLKPSFELSDNRGCFNYSSSKSVLTKRLQISSELSLDISFSSLSHSGVVSTSLEWICIVPLLLVFLIHFLQNSEIDFWGKRFFSQSETLQNLQTWNLNHMFEGHTIQPMNLLAQGPISEFYETICQSPIRNFDIIRTTSQPNEREIPFQFSGLLKAIFQKLLVELKPLMEEKNREILNNKFFMHSSINMVSDTEAAKIKDHYQRAKQIGILSLFFRYGYLSLLKDPEEFDQTINDDDSAIPFEIVDLFRSINRILKSTDVKQAISLLQQASEQTINELQVRIQINLLQKYFFILKDLDIHSNWACQLKLEECLININLYIQNVKYLLTKHNKTIRNYTSNTDDVSRKLSHHRA